MANIMSEIATISTIKRDGVLGRMDEVLKLAKKGYDEASIEYGLRWFARQIKNVQLREIALDAYLRRVK